MPTLRRLADRYLPQGAILLATLTFATYAMGLLRDRLFARTFGLSSELDTYNAAFVLPELTLDVLIASGLTAPFVPIFLGLRHDETEEAQHRAEAFGQSVVTLAVAVMGIASAVLFVIAPLTAPVIAPGFGPEQRDQYVALFRVMLITPVLFAASIALGEILVADRRFLWYGLAPLLYNGGIVLGTVLLSGRIGIFGAAWGAVLGAVAHLGVRLIGALRTGFRCGRGSTCGRVPSVEFIRLMIPKMVSQPIEGADVPVLHVARDDGHDGRRERSELRAELREPAGEPDRDRVLAGRVPDPVGCRGRRRRVRFVGAPAPRCGVHRRALDGRRSRRC